MSEAETIREFLVALGFKVDASGNKKFTDAITKGTKDALAFGAAVGGTATALAVLTDKMAQSVESLYYMSQRTQAAVANIQGLRYANTQLGGSAESATAALESLGQMLRNNPASESYLNSLKVQTRGVNGELLDTTKILSGLGGQLAQMPNWQAKAFADFFHIDERTLLALKSGEFDRFMEDHNRRLQEAGLDMTELSIASHEYELEWRKLNDQAEIFANKRLAVMLPMMTELVRGTESWLEDLTSGASKIEQLQNKNYKGFGDYIDKRGIGGFLWDSLLAGGNQIAGGALQGAQIAGIGFASIFGTEDEKNRELNTFLDNPNNIPTTGGDHSIQSSDKEKQILSTLTGMGWTPAQAAGILANLKAESSLDTAAVGDSGQAYGIAQWHPDRQANFRRFAGKDIRQSSLDEQLRFLNWELNNTESAAGMALRGTSTAGQAGAVISTQYERPRDKWGQASLRSADAERIFNGMQAGGNPVTINQTNSITVNGAGNPQETGQAVMRAQSSANQSLTRNVAGAVQ